MFKNEQGSVVVLAMVVITILLILSTGLMKAMYNETKITSSYEDMIQAGYLAESGVAEVIDTINDELDNDGFAYGTDITTGIYNPLGEGKYGIDMIDEEPDDSDIYVVKVTGKINGSNINKRLRVEIKIETSDIFKKTVASGEEIVEEKSEGQDKVEIRGDTSEGGEIPKFEFSYYSNSNNTDRSLSASDFNIKANKTEVDGGWKDEDGNISLPGGITYINQDVDINLEDKDMYRDSSTDPAIIVVNGDVNIKKPGGSLQNIYFIVKGSFTTANNNNNFTMIDVFIYAETSIDLNGNNLGGSGNNSVDPGFTGGLMSPGEVNLEDISGQGGTFDYSKVMIDLLLDGAKNKSEFKDVNIISWQEI